MSFKREFPKIKICISIQATKQYFKLSKKQFVKTYLILNFYSVTHSDLQP